MLTLATAIATIRSSKPMRAREVDLLKVFIVGDAACFAKWNERHVKAIQVAKTLPCGQKVASNEAAGVWALSFHENSERQRVANDNWARRRRWRLLKLPLSFGSQKFATIERGFTLENLSLQQTLTASSDFALRVTLTINIAKKSARRALILNHFYARRRRLYTRS